MPIFLHNSNHSRKTLQCFFLHAGTYTIGIVAQVTNERVDYNKLETYFITNLSNMHSKK